MIARIPWRFGLGIRRAADRRAPMRAPLVVVISHQGGSRGPDREIAEQIHIEQLALARRVEAFDIAVLI